MANTIISDLPALTPAAGTVLYAENSSQSGKIDYATLAQAIIENYASSTLAGSAQSVKSALDSLNSNYAVNTSTIKVAKKGNVVYINSLQGDLTGTTIPSGYRPPHVIWAPCIAVVNNAWVNCMLQIATGGDIYVTGLGGSSVSTSQVIASVSYPLAN